MFANASRQEIGTLRMLIIGAFIILIPVALITTTIRVAISEPAVYDYAVRNYGAEKASGIPQSELLNANQEIRDYLVNQDSGPLAPQVTDNAGVKGSLFNAKETAHMADVRSLVQLMLKVQVLAVALVLALAVVMIALWPTRALAAAALYGSLLTLAVLGLTGLAAASGFDAAWAQFHGIAFSNDLWELNPRTDHLIQMFPEAFWQDAVTAIGGLIALQALALGIVSGLFLLLTKPEAVTPEPSEPRLLPERDGQPRQARLAPPNPRHYVR
jgi:integral membrane protein (TIGR01906 family)